MKKHLLIFKSFLSLHFEVCGVDFQGVCVSAAVMGDLLSVREQCQKSRFVGGATGKVLYAQAGFPRGRALVNHRNCDNQSASSQSLT
jgi:hypothetical protein